MLLIPLVFGAYSFINIYFAYLAYNSSECTDINHYCQNIFQVAASTLTSTFLTIQLKKIYRQQGELEYQILSLELPSKFMVPYLVIVVVKSLIFILNLYMFLHNEEGCKVINILESNKIKFPFLQDLILQEQVCNSINIFIDFFVTFLFLFQINSFVIVKFKEWIVKQQRTTMRKRRRNEEFVKITDEQRPSNVNTDWLINQEECCVICFKGYRTTRELVQMPCKHFYHKECLNDWFEKNNNCPICRARQSQMDQLV